MTKAAPHRVALLGGSFNPPHICHVLLSLYLLETMDVDAVWWLPVHRHAFAKDSTLAPFPARHAMAEAVAANYSRIAVNDIEHRLSPPSYTFDTVAALRAEHPDTDFSWLIGSDILPELHRWHRWTELRATLRFIVIGRGEPIDDADLPRGGDFVVRDFHLPDVSSTQVRRALAAGDDVTALVPRAALDWLSAHPGLYR